MYCMLFQAPPPPDSNKTGSSKEGDLRTPAELANLNTYLQSRSYICGYVPSQSDTAVYTALSSTPAPDYTHVLRWYNHISSYGEAAISSFPGPTQTLQQLRFSGGGDDKADPCKAVDDDDDFDLFGSDEEDNAAADKLKEERLKAYQDKKSKKPVLIAKSNIILDVKPWDDETDMAALETAVRSVVTDGLLWGQSKLVPLAYGIKKLQISCVVEDDKVGTDFLEESITNFEDLVQSVDIAAFNKI